MAITSTDTPRPVKHFRLPARDVGRRTIAAYESGADVVWISRWSDDVRKGLASLAPWQAAWGTVARDSGRVVAVFSHAPRMDEPALTYWVRAKEEAADN